MGIAHPLFRLESLQTTEIGHGSGQSRNALY